jgi:hypothetical protein
MFTDAEELAAIERMRARVADMRMDSAMEHFDREAVKKLLDIIDRQIALAIWDEVEPSL